MLFVFFEKGIEALKAIRSKSQASVVELGERKVPNVNNSLSLLPKAHTSS